MLPGELVAVTVGEGVADLIIGDGLAVKAGEQILPVRVHVAVGIRHRAVQLYRGQVPARIVGVFRHVGAVGHLGKLVQAVVFVAFHYRTVFGNAHDISKLVVGLRLSVAFSVSIQKMRIRQIFINYQLYYYPVGKFQSVFFVFFV